jgi:hypothetical protein
MFRRALLSSLGWMVLVFLAVPHGVRGETPAPSPTPSSPATGADGVGDLAGEVAAILRRSCFDCHGKEKQKGDLRLDDRGAALGREGVIVPGHPEESELVRRITLSDGDDEFMPARGVALSAAEVDRVRAWVARGAPWPASGGPARHWSYVKPVRSPLPAVRDAAWPRNVVDRYVLARLEREGMRPAPEADRATLIRRLSLDLVGLPPTPQEVDAFLTDTEPGAVERLVDRLLDHPGFGQRWARPWLDLARYGDSHGFQRDDLRDLWAYRDWVVDALNADMPFDAFSIEQLAGDLLPGASESQRIATGFHRNAPTNVEAGSIPEETRINQVIDRVNTTATVWLGSTLACAQCHDHKYDPFTQKDYYQLLAFFNNTAIEADRSNPKVVSSIRFVGPTMAITRPDRDAERGLLQADLERAKRELAGRRGALDEGLEDWLESSAAGLRDASRTSVLAIRDFDSREGDGARILDDGSVLLTGEAPDRDTYVLTVDTELEGIRGFLLEALTDASLPGKGPGRGDARRPNFVLSSFTVQAARRGEDTGSGSGPASEPRPVRLGRASASFSQAKFDVAQAIDDDPKTAWAIAPRFGEPHWAQFLTEAPIGSPGGTTLTFTLVQEFGAARTIGRLRLSAITGDPASARIPAEIARILGRRPSAWSRKDREALVDFRAASDPRVGECRREVQRLEKELAGIRPETTLVMTELDRPRVSTVFRRGDYRTPGEPVGPATPAFLHPLPPAAGPRDRLALARWLVDRENPLTARVTVNRWWAELFGQGLVATAEDFGLKGEAPTHPELLDWLAVEFMEGGWSMKRILRTIVLSATYRQASHATPERLARDDRNRLYARGPRSRLDAEMIRDNALAIAGLISLEPHGPPIRPPQPEGLWTKIGGEKYDYVASTGADRYRRGIYVVWKRGAPYPSFLNFDATERLACTVRRSRSNTPQQALTLLNDPVYVEAAQGLARRVLAEVPDGGVEARLTHAFVVCTSRRPDARELQILAALYRRQLEASRDELSAWYAVATALLNLDETITKG